MKFIYPVVLLPGCIPLMVVCYLLEKFTKLKVLILTILGLCEARHIIKDIVKVLYYQGNTNIVSYHENFKGAKP